MIHGTYRAADGVVIKIHDTDPSLPKGMKPGLGSIAGPDNMQVGWVVHDGVAMTTTDRDNLPHLAEIEKLEREALKPRVQIEALLGKTGYLEKIEAQIEERRSKLK